MQEGSRKAIIAAFFANLGIAVAKFVGLPDHPLGRPARRGGPLAGRHRQPGAAAVRLEAWKPPGRRGAPVRLRARALLLGVRRRPRAVQHGRPVRPVRGHREAARIPTRSTASAVAFGILVFAIVLESYSLRTAVKEANHVRPKDKSWWWFIRNSKSPELPVVLLEDIGAEVGSVLRAGRADHGRGHRQPAVGRRRLDRDRRAAGRASPSSWPSR